LSQHNKPTNLRERVNTNLVLVVKTPRKLSNCPDFVRKSRFWNKNYKVPGIGTAMTSVGSSINAKLPFTITPSFVLRS
jgi:hypothetical protein